MGMTDKQFNTFLRELVFRIEQIEAEPDEKKKAEMLKRHREDLQKGIED